MMKLDPRIWSNLPSDLVFEILKHLKGSEFIRIYLGLGGSKASASWRQNSSYSSYCELALWFPDSTGFFGTNYLEHPIDIGIPIHVKYRLFNLPFNHPNLKATIIHDMYTGHQFFCFRPNFRSVNVCYTLTKFKAGVFTVKYDGGKFHFRATVFGKSYSHVVNSQFYSRITNEQGRTISFSYDMKYVAWINGDGDLVIGDTTNVHFSKRKYRVSRDIKEMKWCGHYLVVFCIEGCVKVYHNGTQVFTRPSIHSSESFTVDPREGIAVYLDSFNRFVQPFVQRIGGDPGTVILDRSVQYRFLSFSPDGSWVYYKISVPHTQRGLAPGDHDVISSREYFFHHFLKI